MVELRYFIYFCVIFMLLYYLYIYILYKRISAGTVPLLIKNLQDPSPDTQVLVEFSFPKATQRRTLAP